jgi:hypothetical protein
MSRPIILWEVHCYCISLRAFFRSFGVSAAMQPRDDQSPLALSPLNVQMKRVTNVEKFLICKQKSPNIWIAMYKSVECVFCARFSFFILSLSLAFECAYVLLKYWMGVFYSLVAAWPDHRRERIWVGVIFVFLSIGHFRRNIVSSSIQLSLTRVNFVSQSPLFVIPLCCMPSAS